ncbi:hypothetical protein HKD37_15G043880 [Glycine soja]
MESPSFKENSVQGWFPYCTDHLTASKGSISFARVLVEVYASLELIKEVRFRFPTVKTFIQKIEYENRSSFCTHCKMIRHRLTKCKVVPIAKHDHKITTTAGPSTAQSQVVESQAIDNVPVLQTPADIAGAVNFESVNPNDGFVQSFLRNKGVNVMAILETKMNTVSVEDTMKRKFGDWNFAHNFTSHNAGKILILWKPEKVTLSVLQSYAQLILYSIDCKVTCKQFQVFFIYGLHSVMAKRSLWINLNMISASLSYPWLLICDFNNILSPTDQFNGAETSAYEMQDFADCYSDLGLGSLNSHGFVFTWTTDHTSLVVTTEVVVPRGNSPFKFNNVIVDHPNFLSIVSDGWSHQVNGCSMFKVCKRLKSLKTLLKLLFNQEFNHIFNRVEQAEAEYNSLLNSLRQNPLDTSFLTQVNRTRGHIILLRKAESRNVAQLIKNRATSVTLGKFRCLALATSVYCI